MDLRAPIEFAKGAFPAASSLPLMTDDERAAVGTCYKQRGQQAAIELGHRLVSGEERQTRLQGWLDFAQKYPDGALYCFRGGLRSLTVQQWMAEAGCVYPRVEGGYKALRNFLLRILENVPKRLPLIVLSGRTGSGKTHVLQTLPQFIDLEKLAHHRGSAFGRLLEPQPSQIDFENALAIELQRVSDCGGSVFVEDESHLIGRCALPADLRAAMAVAPRVELDMALDDRIDGVIEDYIHDLRRRFQRQDPENGAQRHRERLLGDLGRIQKRLGGQRYAELLALMNAAFDAHEAHGDVEGHRAWVRALLTEYYDPMYNHQQAQKARPVVSGGVKAIQEWAAAKAGN